MLYIILIFTLIFTEGYAYSQNITLTGLNNDLYNTGYNGNTFNPRPTPFLPATPLADSHYSLVAIFNVTNNKDVQTSIFLPTPQLAYQAYTSNSNNGLAGGIGGWYAAPSVTQPAQWITIGSLHNVGINQNNYNGGADVVYDYRLTLKNIPLGYKLNITGTTTSDNALLITANNNKFKFFNNQLSVDNNPNSYKIPANFSISFVTQSVNFIDYNVLNDNTGGPTGLQVFDLSGIAIPLGQAVDSTTLMNILNSGIYTPGQVALILNEGLIPISALTPSFPITLSPNGQAVAGGLNQINSNGNATQSSVDLSLALLRVASASDSTAYDAALRSLSPEKLGVLATDAFNTSSFQTLDLDDYLAHRRNSDGDLQVCAGGIDMQGFQLNPKEDPSLTQIKNHLSSPTGLVRPFPDREDDCDCHDRMNFFVRGEVILSQDFSTSALSHSDATTAGVETGVDYQLGKHWLVGALFSYNHLDTSLDNFGSNARVDGYAPGLFASYANGGWFSNSLTTFRFDNYKIDRSIHFDTVNTDALSTPSGNEQMVYEDGGYEFHQGDWTYGPMAGMMYNHLNIDPYRESGGGITNLNINNQSADSLRSRLGFRISRVFKSSNILFTPHLYASWQHELLDGSRQITSSFSEASAANSFTIYTSNPSRDAAVAGVGVDADLFQDITVFLNYDVQAGQSNFFGQALQAGAKVAF